MNRFLRFLLLLSLLAPLLPPSTTAQAGSSTGWIALAPGIDYQEWTLDTPNRVYVARLDRSNPGVTIETSLGQGRLTGKEKISSQFQRYDGALNDWYGDWGARNQVVVAINGSLLEPQPSSYPDRGVVASGWYAKRGRENQSGSGFVYTRDRRAFVGGCVKNPVNQQNFVVLSNGNSVKIDDLNRGARADDQIILYTPQWGATTGTPDRGWEVLVEMDRPAGVTGGQPFTGTVRQIRKNAGSTPIPFDHLVISAGPDKVAKLKNAGVQDGEVIAFTQEINHFSETDCSTAREDSWVDAYASVGGDYIFLRDGKVQPEKYGRNPLTAIALNDQYIFFIVVDGRQGDDEGEALVSLGMTMVEIGNFAKNTLGATWGVNQDGGGSSVMVVKGYVMNIPSDGVSPKPSPQGETSEQDAGPKAAPQAAPVGAPTAAAPQQEGPNLFLPLVARGLPTGFVPPPQEGLVERYLVNGLMMVVSLPKNLSARFSAGGAVAIVQAANVRLGPGTNYAVAGQAPSGASGVVLPHAGGLNGVLAKGSYWWKVQLDTPEGVLTGWVAEELLAAR